MTARKAIAANHASSTDDSGVLAHMSASESAVNMPVFD